MSLATEGQNLLDEVFRTSTRLQHFLKISIDMMMRGYGVESELRETEYRGKDIVKLMRNATRQRADRFQLLTLAKLFFEMVDFAFLPSSFGVMQML